MNPEFRAHPLLDSLAALDRAALTLLQRLRHMQSRPVTRAEIVEISPNLARLADLMPLVTAHATQQIAHHERTGGPPAFGATVLASLERLHKSLEQINGQMRELCASAALHGAGGSPTLN